MEQNKILLITVSVALFLAAILSVGLWLFYPRQKEAGASAVTPAGKSSTFDPIEWVRTREEYPSFTERKDDKKDDVIIVYGEEKAPQTREQAPAAPKTVPVADIPRQAPEPPKAAPRPRQEPAAVQKPKTVTVREYSIQVGSFSSRDRAEQAGQVLRDKGLAGQIVSREVNGAQFYRLRVGPYTNKAEAEKFLTWIRQIQGFENSLIFEGYGTRTVPN
jgi:cell division protein FtsN